MFEKLLKTVNGTDQKNMEEKVTPVEIPEVEAMKSISEPECWKEILEPSDSLNKKAFDRDTVVKFTVREYLTKILRAVQEEVGLADETYDALLRPLSVHDVKDETILILADMDDMSRAIVEGNFLKRIADMIEQCIAPDYSVALLTTDEMWKLKEKEEKKTALITDSGCSYSHINEGVETGGEIGLAVLGIPGAIVGAFVGGAVGCVKEIREECF